MKSYDRSILVFLAAVFIVGIVLLTARAPANDEVYYLNDALEMSRCLANGEWIGSSLTGFHGFLFKLPAALLFLITGPSLVAATLVTLLLAVAALYLCYLIYSELLGSAKWVMAGAFMVASGGFFLRTMPTFLRDIPVLFSLLLFLYLALTKSHKWLMGLSLLLVLEAKEGVFFLVLPGAAIWTIVSSVLNDRENPKPFCSLLATVSGRIFALLFPSVVMVFLMFTTSVVPVNPALSRVLGLNRGGLGMFLTDNFAPHAATRNIEEGGHEIYRFNHHSVARWRALHGGDAASVPRFITHDRLPVVKLTKPSKPSSHESGQYYHECGDLIEPAQYNRGDTVVFSLWYKAPQKEICSLIAVVQYRNKEFPSYRQPISLRDDGQWHFVETRITLTNPGVIRPLFIWPMAQDMVLYVAGCRVKVEKKTGDTGPRAENSRSGAVDVLWTAAGHVGSMPEYSPREMETSGILWQLWQTLAAGLNLLLAYIGKIFYPRTFSITSVPRFIILPAVIMSLHLIRRWKQEKQYRKLLLPIVFWSYLAGYLMRVSMGRYLLPLSPVIILFFLLFLKEGLKKKIFARNTLLAVTFFEILALSFEIKYPLLKLSLTFFFVAMFWLLYYLQHKQGGAKERFKLAASVIIGIISILVFIGSDFANVRQLGRYLTWGYAGQARQVARLSVANEKTWINTGRGMVEFFRNDGTFTPFKTGMMRWHLKDWVPKVHLMKSPRPASTVFFHWQDMREFHLRLQECRIKKVVLAVATPKGEKYAFPYQEHLPLFMNASFLTFAKQVRLKNKILYVFEYTGRD